MSGIAGIGGPGKRAQVERMLDKMTYRGPAGGEIVEVAAGTLGVVWTQTQAESAADLTREHLAQDYVDDSHFAQAQACGGCLVLKRDPLGVSPLYYGHTADGTLCFASEVKAILAVTRDVHALPPGHIHDGTGVRPYSNLGGEPDSDRPAEQIARGLRGCLEAVVEKLIGPRREMGLWLSGGLDSTALAALARPRLTTLHTFAAGFPDSPDVVHARLAAEFVGSEHHELLVDLDDMLAVLPETIYHLESFDALLVRSAVNHYPVARMTSEYVPAVISGEGADEMFSGQRYVELRDPGPRPELADIADRLSGTSLQRVDRCSSAYGMVAHVAFLNSESVEYAMRIPPELKYRDGVEKWILREAMRGVLPEPLRTRTKARFWEGAGVGDLIAHHADRQITDREFTRERTLPNGWTLNTREELMYYRIFKDHFGELQELSWMGRTEDAPRVQLPLSTA